MLRKLRIKFVAIVVMLVGLVLFAVLGFTYLTTVQTHQDLVNRSLTHALQDNQQVQRVSSKPANKGLFPWNIFGALESSTDDAGVLNGKMLVVIVEIDSRGIVLRMNDAPVTVDQEALGSIMTRVRNGESQGYDAEVGMAWNSKPLSSTGGWQIAIIDISSHEVILQEQARKDVYITIGGMVALFAIAWWLSGWALKPVEVAWQQQKQFIADASHELKTPLAVILANIQIIQSQDLDEKERDRWMESTSDEATRMKELVEDMLQLARADETKSIGGGETHLEDLPEIDLSDIAESSLLELDAVAFEQGHMLEGDIEEHVMVRGNSANLSRLIRILIDNACKYGTDGSDINVSLSSTKNHAKLQVHNDGKPISPEDLPHLFDRFYRADKARTGEGKGSFGLGLAIAKEISESHHGKISVKSSEDEGTTFTVTLPLA